MFPCVVITLLVATVLMVALRYRLAALQDTSSSNTIILRNRAGVEVHILPTGASIQKILLPDRNGNIEDVVLGFDEESHYADGSSPYFGALVGRVANRIANAVFTLDGETYRLAVNERGFPGSLHGGKLGFDKVVWEAKRLNPHALKHRRRGEAVQLRYRSPHMEEGYPGTVDAEVTYTLTEGNDLVQSIKATTDRPTVINLAQHSYFNLGGHTSGTILEHELTMPRAMHILPVDAHRIPTGQLAPVQGTPFDFTKPKKIGSRIVEVDGPGWKSGYDHCYVLQGRGPNASKRNDTAWWKSTPRPAVTLYEPVSGRVMDILTTAPGLQLYTSNFLDGSTVGKGGVHYKRYAGVCLETQTFPDGVHHQPGPDDAAHTKGGRALFPSGVLRPGETYVHTTIYRFSVRKRNDTA